MSSMGLREGEVTVCPCPRLRRRMLPVFISNSYKKIRSLERAGKSFVMKDIEKNY
jgi:hypothetical protein